MSYMKKKNKNRMNRNIFSNTEVNICLGLCNDGPPNGKL